MPPDPGVPIPEVRAHPELPVSRVEAPDGGYGWVIVACSYAAYFTGGGTFYTHGIYYPEFLDTFQAGEIVTAWASALQVSLALTLGLSPMVV